MNSWRAPLTSPFETTSQSLSEKGAGAGLRRSRSVRTGQQPGSWRVFSDRQHGGSMAAARHTPFQTGSQSVILNIVES